MTLFCTLNCEACFWIRQQYELLSVQIQTHPDWTRLLHPIPVSLSLSHDPLLSLGCRLSVGMWTSHPCDQLCFKGQEFTQWGRKDPTAHFTSLPHAETDAIRTQNKPHAAEGGKEMINVLLWDVHVSQSVRRGQE